MRVLWICNIMPPAVADRLGRESSCKEGWLSGLLDTILERQSENGIELHLAFPAAEPEDVPHRVELERGSVYCYGFAEDTANAERYQPELEERMRDIAVEAKPDAAHCFGTEYAHTLAFLRAFGRPQRTLVGIQGLCAVCAQAYMADLPEETRRSVTFRDLVRRDGILRQQEKFAVRGEREKEALRLAGHITGRTDFDRYYAEKWNPGAVYHPMNETLRSCFYDGVWPAPDYEPRTIFVSQGDYPLKGLHYVLLAMPRILEAFPEARVKVAGADLTKQDGWKDRVKRSAYGAYLKRLLKENGLTDRVRFLGRLSAEEMKREYLTCGLYVCCSSLENSPNSLGEAMLLGAPCAAADVGGIPSLFTDRVDGILYGGCRPADIEYYNACDDISGHKAGGDESEDVRLDSPEMRRKTGESDRDRRGTEIREEYREASLENDENMPELLKNARRLADAVLRIWNSPEEMKAFCKNARLHAKKTHDPETNYHKLVEIYADICGRNDL